MFKVVIGLGNEMPLQLQSSKYAGTRHNVGADFITYLSRYFKVNFTMGDGFKHYHTHDCHFVVLGNYMNHSGIGVRKVLMHFLCAPQEMLIIHDDIEMQYGQLKFKLTGGHKGHNGLRHIIECLGTPQFWRCSIGVDRVDRTLLGDYVLSRHTPLQKTQMMHCFAYLRDHLDAILRRQLNEIRL